MLTALTIVFVLVLVTGLVLAMVFRKKQAVFLGIIIGIFLINTPVFFGMVALMDQVLRQEIKTVIMARGGEVQEIREISVDDSDKTPFAAEAGKYNKLYRVTYLKNDLTWTAWYRGVNTMNDIHNQSPAGNGMGFGEKWIFEDGGL
ncbi:hypothetical protein [Paenibacillus sp. RC84]|uniref:hypothetical protein n=1 Tax=Paenibacillus sp. RC84 TaxID=3156252 RepID=UPI0035184DE9